MQRQGRPDVPAHMCWAWSPCCTEAGWEDLRTIMGMQKEQKPWSLAEASRKLRIKNGNTIDIYCQDCLHGRQYSFYVETFLHCLGPMVFISLHAYLIFYSKHHMIPFRKRKKIRSSSEFVLEARDVAQMVECLTSM